MIYVLTTLLVIGISLFIISFFMSNRFNDIEQELEQLSMSQIQNQYVLNNKIKVLEEELLSETMDINFNTKQEQSKETGNEHKEPAIVARVKNLYQQGYNPKEIEQQTGLAEDDVKIIIQQKSDNQVFA
ncbi:hypothetical protein [Alkalibacillus almallahensis]|uniref:hypothetical protein n=1 Tax=Alkalibacillus almallahensis TaxID=1379154 RepID=UPI0014233A1C|nr:hypothetical protein [Alkalibacillus almallahensis]NIK13384.1 flagellar biosynthesis protein FliP [Alkalibacillus almallahensis]